jgi:Fic family protein
MQTIEPYAGLTRYSPDVTHQLGRIEAARKAIDSADIWPASAEALRLSAQVGTIHYSTLIEGNRLGVLEAQRAARGELDAKTKAEIELVNYVDALKLIDERQASDGLAFTEDLLKAVHREATKGLGTPEGPFMPHHEGEWRDGEVVVPDPLAGAIMHEGAPQKDVRRRMLGLVEWVQSVEERQIAWPIPVVAGIVHFNIAEVHPFADGNGRTARLIVAALLIKHDYAPGRLFNFDAHYGKDKDAYLAALRSVRLETFNQESWMRYLLDGLALEYERVLEEIERLSVIGQTRKGLKVQLTQGQQRALTELVIQNRSEFVRTDYEKAGEVSRSQAASDLKDLADSGVLERVGEGKARRYRFASSSGQNPWTDSGAPRTRWTDERIESELRNLMGEDERFPSIKQFEGAGRRDLYNAIQRHGGSAAWAERTGVPAPRRGAPPGG